MTFSCWNARDSLLENRGMPRSGDLVLNAHLGGCSDCSAFARRTASIASSLSAMARRTVPVELDGLVVAATQAGRRQDRAVRSLAALERLSTPSDLEERVLEDCRIRARAPSVLERLVDEDLRDPAAALARRFASRLDRRPAPRALHERLSGSARAFLRPRGSRRVLSLAAGLTLCVLVSAVILSRRLRERESDNGFRVVYESSLDAMDPMARGLLTQLSGGLVDSNVAREAR
jgi:hypothetical protein